MPTTLLLAWLGLNRGYAPVRHGLSDARCPFEICECHLPKPFHSKDITKFAILHNNKKSATKGAVTQGSLKTQVIFF